MRRRYQKGSLQKKGGSWILQWWENGRRKKKRLGRMTKTQAELELAAIVAPINRGRDSHLRTFGEFVKQVYLPFFKRKWKRSTIMTNEHRIRHHLLAEFEAQTLSSFDRQQLQEFLEGKGSQDFSYSMVNHLRWDLKQVFGMAVAEGCIERNPAALLFAPRECQRPSTSVMSIEEVRKLFLVLELRERLIAALAVIAGLRPGEIFGLTWGRLNGEYADIRQRVYKGDVDSPKSLRSVRWAALSDGLSAMIRQWRECSPDTRPEAWVFPSERLVTPVAKENCWRRNFLPRLNPIGLAWVNFQVMRRSHSCLLKELDVDPQVRAEQMGHTVDVNENVYTRTSLERRREAVNALESALQVI